MNINGLGGAQDNFLYYILTNIHKFKVGTITKISNNEYAEVNFHINENKHDMPLMSFPILPLFIKHEYKVNQDVVVGFFDDYEQSYIEKKTNKILSLNNLYLKHALSNGYIILPLRKQNDCNITFTQDGDIIIDSLQSTISLKHTGDVTITNKQSTIDLKYTGDVTITNKQSTISLQQLTTTIQNQTGATIALNVDGSITIANLTNTLATLLLNIMNSFKDKVKILDSNKQQCEIDIDDWIKQNTPLIASLLK